MKRHEPENRRFFLIFERTFQEASLEELVESAQLARDITICGFAQNVFHGVEKHGEEIDGMIEKALYRLDQKTVYPVSRFLCCVPLFMKCCMRKKFSQRFHQTRQ